jgi:two-component system, NarL family, sensor histidine kinase DevS
MTKALAARNNRPARKSAAARPRGAPDPEVDTAVVERALSTEAEQTLSAIRSGQVDALVIRDKDADRLYAVRSFADIEQSRAALRAAGAERIRTAAQLQALAEERERLFQDLHDGCIQSIYAVGLNLETCMRLIDENPRKAGQMIGDATASLNLVIQELRSFIVGHRLAIAADRDLRSEIEMVARTATNHGLDFSTDIDESVMRSLTAEQALHFLQIAREGISNAIRHARARKGCVSLRLKRGTICLEIRDDGTGIATKRINKLGLGLHHIEARARKMGGTAQVISAPKKGTRIIVELRKSR